MKDENSNHEDYVAVKKEKPGRLRKTGGGGGGAVLNGCDAKQTEEWQKPWEGEWEARKLQVFGREKERKKNN